MSKTTLGILLALAAAGLNGSIGIFSKFLLQSGLNAQDIAFLKTLAAFVILSLILSRRPLSVQKRHITSEPHAAWTGLLAKIAVCAFLGIFVLFFFETAAYQYGFASDVVVVLMASAAVSALIFGRILLHEPLYLSAISGTLSAVAGIFMISWSGGSSPQLMVNAVAAGSGYGIFSVLVKKFGLNGGLDLTRVFMFFGSLYLFFPYWAHSHPIRWEPFVIANILALAVLPTILGFYCTTKALNYLSAAKVQVTELSEPLFTVLLAWLFLNETPEWIFFIGAFFIVSGIALINQLHRYRLAEKY